jgi:hypothetical protein
MASHQSVAGWAAQGLPARSTDDIAHSFRILIDQSPATPAMNYPPRHQHEHQYQYQYQYQYQRLA